MHINEASGDCQILKVKFVFDGSALVGGAFVISIISFSVTENILLD
jgi:hypothetical protein